MQQSAVRAVQTVQQGCDNEDRRASSVERRTNNRKAVVHSFYRKRRNTLRRDSDDMSNVYVDTHEPKLWYLALGLMLLSVLDAFFTTILIQNGSEELNPVLDFLLKIDLSFFLAAKFFVTGSVIVFFVLHKHHRFLDTVNCYQLLVASVFIYTVLICYQFSMVRLIPGLV